MKNIVDNKNAPLIVITGASGAGKTTLVKKLLIALGNVLSLSISATTRKMRDGEIDGKDYFFLAWPEFRERIKNGLFAEYAMFSGNIYGTLVSEVDRIIAEGKIPIFDIEVQGVRQLKEKYGNRVKVILIVPPNDEELRKRLNARGTETPKSLEKRFRQAKADEAGLMEYANTVIENGILEEAKDALLLRVCAMIDKRDALKSVGKRAPLET